MRDYITELAGLKDYEIKKSEPSDDQWTIHLVRKRVPHFCPACGAETSKIHDYYPRRIQDTDAFGQKIVYIYHRRRFVCPACGKRFAEKCDLTEKYQRFTDRVAVKIMERLHHRISITEIAHELSVSISTVQRVLKIMPASTPSLLPEAISFDEFKGDTGDEKFQCIVTDPFNKKVFDVLPSRTVSSVQEYLKQFQNRDAVHYAVMDMNRGFFDVAKTFLPNAQIIIDRFHVVKHCTDAMEEVRRDVQKTLDKDKRRYFKHSKKLLLAHRDNLDDEGRIALDVMLRHSDKLAQAYALKEHFYHFMKAPDSKEANHRLNDWFAACDRLNIPEFNAFRKMLLTWSKYILNAFDVHLSNGYTEGVNNATKALKRVAFGFHRFDNLRKRILLTASLHPNI